MCECINEANVTFAVGGNLIYKDECTKCFHTNVGCLFTQQMGDGLKVCLKCFNGGCFGENSFNHADLHYAQTGHCLVLIIKRVLKHNPATDPQAITKVAIGKEGGAQFDELWETLTAVECLKCKKLITDLPPMLQGLVDSIVIAKSAYEAQSVGEWEAELKPCIHSKQLKTVEGAGPIAGKALAHCNDCLLSTNLWLCLHCGYLGCGRRYYDGSGGNNHAVDHGKETGHCVVVKMGTITPEGKASIHCYKCDDEILDENLAEHLAVFGIDVQSQRKTEKTQAELELQANLNLNLSKIIEQGQLLIPKYGPGMTGLNNLGNTCYMSAVLQVLFSLQPFIDRYMPAAIEHISNCTKPKPALCYHCQIYKLAHGLLSGKYSQKKQRPFIEVKDPDAPPEIAAGPPEPKLEDYQDGIKPHMFKGLIGGDHPEFRTGAQQDALQYLNFLIEKIQRGEKAAGQKDPTKIFDFKMETRLQCTACKCVRYSSSKSSQLTLLLPEEEKVEGLQLPFNQCLQLSMEPELVEYNCPKCKKTAMFTKTQRFQTLPKVMIASVHRFSLQNWVPKKVNIDLTQLEAGKPVNLEQYMGRGLQAGEEELPDMEEFDMEEPAFDAGMLGDVIAMGVPELHAKHALLNTNQQSAELAVSWYFENLGNPTLEGPIPKVKKSKPGAAAPAAGPSEADISTVMMMGFTLPQASFALRKCDNSVERAVDYLFNHPEETGEEEAAAAPTGPVEEQKEEDSADSSAVVLKGFVTHLGASVGCGHYVAHVHKGSEWIYYNDDKVASTDRPPTGKAYIYFFERV